MWDLLKNFLLWGCLGLLVEVLFTGIKSVLAGNKLATSKTYLWMLPIYGIAGLSFKLLYQYVHVGWILQVPMWGFMILGYEYGSGWLLRKYIGACPWDYEHRKWSIHGLIRLDYVPYWMLLAGAQWYALSHVL